MRISCRYAALVFALHSAGTPVHGQVIVGAFGGFHAPTADFPIPEGGFTSMFGPTNAKHEVTFTYGALVRAWFSTRLGLEASFACARGDLVLSPPFPSAPDSSFSASLTVLTANLLYRVPVGVLPNTVWLAAGASWIHHGSPRYKGIDGTSRVAVGVGLGTGIPLTGPFRVEVAFDALVYPYDLKSATDDPPGHTQIDLRARAGVSVALSR